jgi:subtilisin family serine protease
MKKTLLFSLLTFSLLVLASQAKTAKEFDTLSSEFSQSPSGHLLAFNPETEKLVPQLRGVAKKMTPLLKKSNRENKDLIIDYSLAGELTDYSRFFLFGKADKVADFVVSNKCVPINIDVGNAIVAHCPQETRAGERNGITVVRDPKMRFDDSEANALLHANELANARINGLPVDGKGIGIALLDAGVACNHPLLAGKCLKGFNFAKAASGLNNNYYEVKASSDYGDYPDSSGHGTRIAGVIAGKASAGEKYSGIAQGTSIIVYKLRDKEGEIDLSLMLYAIRQASADPDVKIISISTSSAPFAKEFDCYEAPAKWEKRESEIEEELLASRKKQEQFNQESYESKKNNDLKKFEEAKNKLVQELQRENDLLQEEINLIESKKLWEIQSATLNLAESKGRLVIASAGNKVFVPWYAQEDNVLGDLANRIPKLRDFLKGFSQKTDKFVSYGLGFPACYSTVLPVGSVNKKGALSQSSEEGASMKRGVVAPGEDLFVPSIDKTTGVNNYAIAGGTSYSAPLVSGVAALMLQANPGLSPSEIRKIITDAAAPIGDSQKSGHGIANACKAVAEAAKKANKNLGVTCS